MRTGTVSYKVEDLRKGIIIPIGFVGENDFTRVIIDAEEIYKQYPEAQVSMKVQPPKGSIYPATVTKDGNSVIWQVKAADVAHRGGGELQLTFTEGETVIKTYIARTDIKRSLAGNGPAPDPVEDWLDEAQDALDNIEAAEVHQPIIGLDGYWYRWDAEAGEYVTTGTKAQGHSPVLTSSKSGKTTTIYSDGDQLAQILDGEDAQGADVIDDTAGEGDTDKTWSADKLAEETEELKSGIQGVKDDTEGNFANLVTIINGYEYLHEVLTEGKYAKYTEKATPTLSECNVLTFDVSHVAKFQYTYFIANPDARGLFFTDKDDNYISGVQTKSTAQNITVPSGAVKCYASVISSDNIVVYEIFAGDPPVELLKDQASYTDKDNSGGIKYTWASDHKTIKIKGTRTGTSYDQMAGSSSALPTGMEAGKKYLIQFDGISANINCALLIYVNGTNTLSKRFNKPTKYTIPAETTGLIVRLEVNGSGAVVDETVNCPEIYTVPDVKGLDERVTALEHAAYTDDSTNPLAYIRRDAGFLSLFHTVGCIGDSLASGESAYKSGGTTHYVDRYAFSWGQCLARLTGNTYYNFSQGGLSSKTWLSSQHCTDCFDGNHTCDMYFIGLGQNDKNQSLTVGTTADINLSDYTQNADTYCGNMGQIIQRLQILQPKAPIFVFIDPAPPSGDQTYNNVIPDIVDLFDNVWIIDLKTYAKALFTEPTEIIGSQLRSGHYSALGYQEIAFVIATYVDWIVRNNLSDFSQVEFIGTNYEWTT